MYHHCTGLGQRQQNMSRARFDWHTVLADGVTCAGEALVVASVAAYWILRALGI